MVQAFNTIVREQRAGSLTAWIEQACASGVAELRRFALGLLKDEATVRASLIEPYSQGQVEGQVNRLKQLKRHMYGRADFDLLRIRVLHRAL
ncbi:MAG: transposase [Herpetosiphonaceae bacterium]|nr:transposase [Herpetosiphonaceae bacterium]